MRVGIFSDVHANIEAMTAVTAALSRESIDVYYCLGDVVGYGASPNECCNLVRDLARVTIVGNHDAAVAGRMDYSYYYDAARHALDTHAAQLSTENMTWLKGLPYKRRIDAANRCADASTQIKFDRLNGCPGYAHSKGSEIRAGGEYQHAGLRNSQDAVQPQR